MGAVVCFKSILLCALIFLLLPLPNTGKRGGSTGGRGKAPSPSIKTGAGQGSNAGRGTGSNTGWGGGGSGLGTGSKNTGGGGFGAIGRSSYGSLTPTRKAAVAGALGAGIGAFAGYQMGKAVAGHHYGSWHYGGHTYYYGDRYYHPTAGRRKCVFEVDERTRGWNVTDPTDNRLVREIIFECNSYEYCCDMSCCRNPDNVHVHGRNTWSWWQTLVVILALGALFSACAFCLIKQVKKRRMMQENNSMMPTAYVDESNKPFVSPNYTDGNQGGYYGGQQQTTYYPTQSQQPYVPAYPAAYGGAYPPPQQNYPYPPQPQNPYPPPSYQPVPNY